jgi:Protein of unknown function (DUF3515)
VAPATDSSSDGPPRSLLIAAVAVAVAAIIAVLVVAAVRQLPEQLQPIPLPSVPAPQADSPECHALINALPDQLGDYRRAPAAEPAPKGTAAWQAAPDAEPVILRCGLERPVEFVVGVPLQVVDAVQWFEVTDQGRSTWFAVDRGVYIALTLPAGSGPMPIQEMSELIARKIAAKPLDPGPAR